MRVSSRAAAGCILAAASLSAADLKESAFAADSSGPCSVRKEANVPAKMRDGTVLYADIYRPVQDGAYPILLIRLPYNKALAQSFVYGPPEWYAAQCYIVVSQDVRGQFMSQGTFYPLRNEMDDGYDTVEWAAQLPGSTGKVGMYGFSYVGATQWLAATQAPPHLTAIVPAHTSSDYYDGWFYEGGAFSLAFAESWPLSGLVNSAIWRFGQQKVVDQVNKGKEQLQAVYAYLPVERLPWLVPDQPEIAGYFFDWIKHDTRDEYWRQWSIRDRWSKVTVPALNIGGWYDVFLAGTIENFTGMRTGGGSEVARKGQQLIIRPYDHMPWVTKVGDVEFGGAAANKTNEQMVRWFDYWLKGKNNGVDKDPRVRVFVMGANTWREAEDWPIPGTRFTTYFLHSLGQANSLYGNGILSTEAPGDESPDQFVYDPADPVPSRGGHSCCTAATVPQGPYDQGNVEKRADVLVYSTPPLTQAVEVTGPIKVTLHAASSAVDTDWTIKLVDVFPDGRVINVSNGILRASSRNSLDKREPIEPGKVYAYAFNASATSNLFAAGHQIRIEISSSNFPHYDRNLNNGHAPGSNVEMMIARQIVHHNSRYPSQIVLPIMTAPSKTAANP
jgi:putative CocE/NonD family hydrolase